MGIFSPAVHAASSPLIKSKHASTETLLLVSADDVCDETENMELSNVGFKTSEEEPILTLECSAHDERTSVEMSIPGKLQSMHCESLSDVPNVYFGQLPDEVSLMGQNLWELPEAATSSLVTADCYISLNSGNDVPVYIPFRDEEVEYTLYAPVYIPFKEPVVPQGEDVFKPKWPYGSCWPYNHAPTTLILSNLPHELKEMELLGELNAAGFTGFYDFIFMPTSVKNGRSHCRAIVNLTRHSYGLALAAKMHEFKDWSVGNGEACKVEWSLPMQGFIEHIEHYRNHPWMHEIVPDALRPKVFADGWRVPFPPPTKWIREPRAWW